jgi:hypothetical protein
MRLAVVMIALVVACGSEATSQCNELCEKEARCVDELNEESDGEPGYVSLKFDAGECAAACKALARDTDGLELVKKHAECVAAAGDDCRKLHACP